MARKEEKYKIMKNRARIYLIRGPSFR